jgi:OOP family OmpA-OmpF porin
MKYMVPIVAVLMLLGIAPSFASARGLYGGAGIGNTFFSSEVKDALDQIKSIDENSTSWKIFGGFQGPKIIGVEGGYRSFGTVSSSVSGEAFKSKTTGWDLEALGRLEIAIIDIFAKAGVMFWSQDVTLLGLSHDDSGTDFLWGLGAGVHLGPIGGRLEWEQVVISGPDNVSMVSLSASLGF